MARVFAGSLLVFVLPLSGQAHSLANVFPNLYNLTELARDFPQVVLDEIRASPLRAVAPVISEPMTAIASTAGSLPTVVAHGMGDSCWEPGMASITRGIGKKTSSYAKCVPTGNNIITDTINGYLLNMDKSLDVFAAKIRADSKLAGGFNAIGFSQGNSLIRGYIEKYNDPPVNAFISVHGTVMGVAAFPSCFEQGKPLGLMCKALAEVLGDLAYLELAQGILFQADYYRDPTKVTGKAYLTNSQLAQWNNENPATVNKTIVANFAKTSRFAMVKALQDSMVYPNEGEWWGAIKDGSYGLASEMKATKFYAQDLFGIQTADAAADTQPSVRE
jgi:palmitoyl-protein thioesterase